MTSAAAESAEIALQAVTELLSLLVIAGHIAEDQALEIMQRSRERAALKSIGSR